MEMQCLICLPPIRAFRQNIQIIGFAAPELAGEWPEKSGLEWPFPHLVGSATDPQNMRVMHRMNINGEIALEAIRQFIIGMQASTILMEHSVVGLRFSMNQHSLLQGFRSMMLNSSNLIQACGMEIQRR